MPRRSLIYSQTGDTVGDDALTRLRQRAGGAEGDSATLTAGPAASTAGIDEVASPVWRGPPPGPPPPRFAQPTAPPSGAGLPPPPPISTPTGDHPGDAADKRDRTADADRDAAGRAGGGRGWLGRRRSATRPAETPDRPAALPFRAWTGPPSAPSLPPGIGRSDADPDPADALAGAPSAAGAGGGDVGAAGRGHARVAAPFSIVIGDARYRALNWSLSGFAFADPEGHFTPGSRFSFRGRFHLTDSSFLLELVGVVARRDGDVAGCRFEELSPAQRQLLRFLFGAYRTGFQPSPREVAAFATPRPDRADPPSGEAGGRAGAWARRGVGLRGFRRSAAPGAATARSRWLNRPWRATRINPVALLAYLAVLGLAGLVFVTVLARSAPEIDSVVAATITPQRTVNAALDGTVQDILAVPGQRVEAGDPLFVLVADVDDSIISNAPGQERRVEVLPSPCRCSVDTVAVELGDTVRFGEPMATVSDAGGGLLLAVQFTDPQAAEWGIQTPVEVRVIGLEGSRTGRIAPAPQPEPPLPPVFAADRITRYVAVPDTVSPGNGVPARVRWRGLSFLSGLL